MIKSKDVNTLLECDITAIGCVLLPFFLSGMSTFLGVKFLQLQIYVSKDSEEALEDVHNEKTIVNCWRPTLD